MTSKVSPSPLFNALAALFAAAATVRAESREFNAHMKHVAGLIGSATEAEAAAICQSLRTPPAGIGRGERSAVIRGLANAGEKLAAEMPSNISGTFYRVTFSSVAGSVAVNVTAETRDDTLTRIAERDAVRAAEREAKQLESLAARVAALDAAQLDALGLVAKSA